MIFADEEVRNQFHQAGTLLQVICSVLEFEAAKFQGQLELLDFHEEIAYLVISGLTVDELLEVCERLTKLFKLKEKKSLLRLTNLKQGFLEIKDLKPEDLSEPN